MNLSLKYLLVIIIFNLQSQTALSGEITLLIQNTTRVTASAPGNSSEKPLLQVSSEFKISNQGTDPAQNVLIQAKLFEQKRTVLAAREIKPGESGTASIDFALPSDSAGAFPIFVTVLYEDTGGGSFSNAALAVARTAEAPESMLSLRAVKDTQSARIICQISAEQSLVRDVTLTCHVPDDLIVSQNVRSVKLKDGKASAEFDISNRKGLAGSRYGIFITAEYEDKGIHYLSYSDMVIPIEQVASASLWLRYKLLFSITLGVLSIIIAVISIPMTRKSLFRLFGEKSRQELLLDILTILIIEGFILSQLSPEYLMTQITTTGGDTASHYYTADYLRHKLLPKGEIGGWTPGNYAGFPILQFYFPLPFLLMCAMDILIPLQVAFKWISLSGTFLMPPAIYIMLRFLRCPFPGPAIGSVFSLPFLFNPANSMWGGNILSTLAGEFTYSMSLSISLIFLGSLYQGCMENRHVIRNAFLVFLVGFSHGYTLLFAEAVSLFFLITPHGFLKRLTYMLRMYALGFFFLAFWLVPLLAFTKDTTAYHLAWVIYSIKEVIPDIFLPILIIAIISTVAILTRTFLFPHSSLLTPLAFLWFGLLISCIMFVTAPKLGVVDIRYVPCGQLMVCMIAALGLGYLGKWSDRSRSISWIGLTIIIAATLVWTAKYVENVPAWCKWNYEGFEAKKDWPIYRDINDAVKGTFQDPRVVYEHSSIHNSFGTTRAFESLPLFAGRATLEGLYMQASLSAPFVFYIQSEISKEKSCPFRQYMCTDMDFGRAKHHLEMFNVRELILRSEEAKTAIRTYPQYYRLRQKIGEYEIWELFSHEGRYVVPLRYEPVLYHTTDWKSDAYRWFITDELSDVHIVFVENPKDTLPLKIIAKSFENIRKVPIDTGSCQIKETIRDEEILIETNWINKPLLVKVSYHQNWQVEGADRIYRVSPAFMLIFPKQEKVRLYYAPGIPKTIGFVLTGLGLVILLLNVPLPWKQRQTAWQLTARYFGIPESLEPPLKWNLSHRIRWILLALGLIMAFLFVSWVGYYVYTHEPNRLLNNAVKLKDAKQFESAREGFRKVMDVEKPMSGMVADAAYFISVCYFLENNNPEAIKAFKKMIEMYPQGGRTPEAYYHIGICYLRMGQQKIGIDYMNLLKEKYPYSVWTGYAQERLKEINTPPAQIEYVPKLGLGNEEKSGLGNDGLTDENVNEYMGKAIHLFNQDRIQEAKPIFKEIGERFPDFQGAPQALACLALIHYKQKDYKNTIFYYRKLIERYREDKLVPEAYFHIGLSHELLGNRKEAETAYLTGAEKFPKAQFGELSAEKLKTLKIEK